MSKTIKFDEKVAKGLGKGIKKLAKAVKITLGPKGNTVILKSFGQSKITKDGVSVAKEVELDDPIQDAGASMVKDVALLTNDAAGDGTTTATVLAEAIYSKGQKLLEKGVNRTEMKRGMNKALSHIVTNLERDAKPVKTIEDAAQIATISSNGNTQLGELIAEAFNEVGKMGVVTVEESQSIDTHLNCIEGMELKTGYVSPYFITDAAKGQCVLEDTLVMLVDGKIESMNDLVPILEKIIANKKKLLIIADGFDAQVIAGLALNKMKGGMKIAAVKSPSFGDNRKEVMKDIAALTGGIYISSDLGKSVKEVQLLELGVATRAVITSDTLTLMAGSGGKSEAVLERLSLIEKSLDTTKKEHERINLQDRYARLTGKVAIVYVGGVSTIERSELLDLAEDAKNATKSAIAEGIVEGGGVALVKASIMDKTVYEDATKDERIGIDIVHEACLEPMRTILANAGEHADVHIARVIETGLGFDANKMVTANMWKAGIVDPLKVTKSALVNAVSVSGTLLTSDCIIVNDTKDENEMYAQMMRGMGQQ